MKDQEIKYSIITDYLESEIRNVIELLKSNQTAQLQNKKKQLDRALMWLKKGEKFQIDPKSYLIELPQQKTPTPSSEYRIIEDHESDNELNWQEIDVNGKQIRPMPGDLILLKKR